MPVRDEDERMEAAAVGGESVAKGRSRTDRILDGEIIVVPLGLIAGACAGKKETKKRISEGARYHVSAVPPACHLPWPPSRGADAERSHSHTPMCTRNQLKGTNTPKQRHIHDRQDHPHFGPIGVRPGQRSSYPTNSSICAVRCTVVGAGAGRRWQRWQRPAAGN